MIEQNLDLICFKEIKLRSLDANVIGWMSINQEIF